MKRLSGMSLVAAALVLACATAAPAAQYQTYANDRFGTTADVPTGWSVDPPPENGDGLVFHSPDHKGKITVYGSLHVWDTVDEAMQTFEPADGAAISYRHREPRALVISGTRGGTIFYAKHILSCRDQVWNSVTIEYPASQKAAYDAVVTHIAHSLHSGPAWQVDECK